MPKNSAKPEVPKSMKVQLGRLFGAESLEATRAHRTAAQWKATLRKVLHELDRYVQQNVDSDELHSVMIASGLFAADESLKDDDFWPGYVEGLTRVALVLLGDYPDHRRRRGGARRSDHYALDLHRTLQYTQSRKQRFRTLLAAGGFGLPGLSPPPREVLTEFRNRYGSKPTHEQFMRWYKKHCPEQYALVFS